MMKRVKTVILGAGLSGLSAAYHLKGRDFVVIEKAGKPARHEHDMQGLDFEIKHQLFLSSTAARMPSSTCG